MDVKEIMWKRVLLVSFVYSAFFFWFLRAMYFQLSGGLGIFSASDNYALFFYTLSGLFAVGVMLLKWDITPLWFRLSMPLLASLLTLLIPATMQFNAQYGWIGVFVVLLITAACAFCSVLCFEVLTSMSRLLDALLSIVFCFLWFLPLSLIYQAISDGMVQYVFLAVLPLFLLLLLRLDGKVREEAGGRVIGRAVTSVQPVNVAFLRTPSFVRLLFLACAGGFVNIETQAAIGFVDEFAPLVTDIIGISIKLLSSTVAVQTVYEYRYPRATLFALSYLLCFLFYLVDWVVLKLLPILPSEIGIFFVCAVCLGVILSYLIWPPRFVGARVLEQTLDEEIADASLRFGLTNREAEVLACLLRGRNVPMINKELSISEGTSRTHINRIYRKLGVHSRMELFEKFGR
jgi:DNA-binding CsgD family transcriptional regulator